VTIAGQPALAFDASLENVGSSRTPSLSNSGPEATFAQLLRS